jgi:hypothetical protein
MNDVFLKGLSSSQVSNWLGQNSYGNIPVPARTGRVVPTSLQYLVIGGGGGAGTGTGGGGGAGGYRCSVPGETMGGGGSAESEISVVPGQKFIIIVGAGGSGEIPAPQHPSVAKNGSPSYFGGIIAYGGGAGGAGIYLGERPGYNGGCGGGAGAGYYGAYTGGLAYTTPTQGYAGGVSQGNNNYCGGGGGGAGAIGTAGTVGVTSRGSGGAGLSSAITGTSITRAGGGGGGSLQPVTAAGGSGGGGNGNSVNNGNGSNATINTGSGGGGGGYAYPIVTAVGGNGGKGIVIIRYPSTFSLAASTSGSPTQTTTGGYHIYVFNDSGSITF